MNDRTECLGPLKLHPKNHRQCIGKMPVNSRTLIPSKVPEMLLIPQFCLSASGLFAKCLLSTGIGGHRDKAVQIGDFVELRSINRSFHRDVVEGKERH